MDGKNYSAVPPPPSLSADKPLDFNSALSKARAIAEKLKQQSSAPGGAPPAYSTGLFFFFFFKYISSKRSYEEDQDSYRSQQRSFDQDERSSKRSAYDGGASRPSHANEARRYGLGSEERRANGECNVPNNMVGLIIGKNGDNLKKIERVSGAKVQFSDDNGESERKVRLSGEHDQIKIARDMIQQMLADAGGMRSNESLIIKIPSSKVGLVIGRKGETIRDFEERSKAKILMASDASADKDNERIITLVGDAGAIQTAKQLIEDILYGSEYTGHQHNNDGGRRFGQQQPQGPGAEYGDGGRYGAVMPRGGGMGGGGMGRANEEHESIRVPVRYVGLIIGKRGETIRTLQEQSGARIKIDNGDGSGDERIVNIFGEASKVAIAKQLVEDKVAEGNANNAGGGGRFGGNNNRGGYRQYNDYNNNHFAGYQDGQAGGGGGEGGENNYDYSQYNQYYGQYGYEQGQYQQQQQQQQQGSGDNQGYQQYPGYQYGYGATDGSTSNESENKNKPPGNNDDKEGGGDNAQQYYAQYYANQTPEQQEAYYQWYQQYYGQQYYDQQGKAPPSSDKSETAATAAAPPPPPSTDDNAKE
ncbi:eukaryotic type KH-domain (KH-domain type I) [Backusella circina FSU 941]|nr:eukaryotic type KH-domain (KH-domain type I) [Backusella circina FSU 941]